MIIKALEIRDRATCIPAVAIKMVAANTTQDRFLWRCGYPRDGSGVVLMKLHDQQATSDAYGWGNDARTMPAAHLWIEQHFDELAEGQVIDVRVILGEEAEPAPAEITFHGHG